MLSVLARPYPPFSASWRGAAICLVAGLSVFAILFLLKPFGMTRFTAPTQLLHSGLYAAATTLISLLLTVAVPAAWPRLFAEERWTVGREIASFTIVVIVIAVANMLINNQLANGRFNGAELLRFLRITLSVGILPIILAILFKHETLYKKYRGAAELFNRQLHQQPVGPHPPPAVTAVQQKAGNLSITLTGDNQKEQLQLPLNSLLLISAADNYVNILHTSNGGLETVLFRGALKKMETMLLPYPQFFRCHRSYLVNLDHVRQITGNAQGYKLEVTGLQQPVPVGRNYNDAIKTKLNHLHGQA